VKLVKKPAVKLVKKPAVKLVKKPAVKLVKKPAVKPVKKPAVKPGKKPAVKPVKKISHKILFSNVGKKRRFNYEKAAKKLKAYGVKVSLKSSSGKAKIKKQWREYAGYINHTEKPRSVLVVTAKAPVHHRRAPAPKKYNFKFQKLTAKERKAALASKLFSKHQFTGTGIFIEKPVNIPARKFKVSFHGKSVKIVGGNRRDIITQLDAEKLLENPEVAVRDAVETAKKKGRVKSYSLLVNGYRSRHSSQSLKIFTRYIKDELMPQWLEKNEGKTEEDFADVFHLRLIY
jgi:hypothetical protein